MRALSHTRSASSLVASLRTPLTRQPGPMVSCPHYLSLCLSRSSSLSAPGLSLTRRSSLALSLSLARALALAPRLIHNCVIEDTINNPTCSNGVLPSRTPLTSQPAAMVSCRHPSSLSLSLSLCRPLFPSLVLSLSHLSCRSCSRAAFALALSLINWSLLRGRYCRGNLLEWCPGLIRLICTCVIEDTINNRTCWNGVLPSLFVSLSLGRLLFLSRAIFDPSLISRSLALSLSRARAHSCSKAHLHLCPRGHH